MIDYLRPDKSRAMAPLGHEISIELYQHTIDTLIYFSSASLSLGSSLQCCFLSSGPQLWKFHST